MNALHSQLLFPRALACEPIVCLRALTFEPIYRVIARRGFVAVAE